MHDGSDPGLAGTTGRNFEAPRAPVLIVPLGATEQHGPHLPFGTDTAIAAAWADQVAARVPGAIAAPALPYGSSGEHQDFPGTLSIGRAALEHLLIELGRSARATFRTVVFLSGHAGNVEPVRAAVATLGEEGDDVYAFFPTWPDVDGTIDAHAGRTETSLLLHLAPDSVDLDAAAAGNTTPIGELLADLRVGGVAAVSANGVLGDPTGASAEEGRGLLDDLVDRTVAAVTAAIGGPGRRDRE